MALARIYVTEFECSVLVRILRVQLYVMVSTVIEYIESVMGIAIWCVADPMRWVIYRYIYICIWFAVQGRWYMQYELMQVLRVGFCGVRSVRRMHAVCAYVLVYGRARATCYMQEA